MIIFPFLLKTMTENMPNVCKNMSHNQSLSHYHCVTFSSLIVFISVVDKEIGTEKLKRSIVWSCQEGATIYHCRIWPLGAWKDSVHFTEGREDSTVMSIVNIQESIQLHLSKEIFVKYDVNSTVYLQKHDY